MNKKSLTPHQKKQIIGTIVCVLLFFLFFSWFYRWILAFAIVWIWRKEIGSKIPFKYTPQLLFIIFFIGIFCMMPRYRIHTSDRVRLLYQNAQGEVVHPPLYQYAFDVIFPEEELMNAGILLSKMVYGWPVSYPHNSNNIVNQVIIDCHNGKLNNFYHSSAELSRQGLFLMSGITSQLCNMVGLPKTQSVYVITPKNFDPNKKYPVVFFCHGYLGNWKLFQSVLMDLENCVVVSAGTQDWSGLFQHKDIASLFKRQIPFLESLGIQVDRSKIHLMGLSNGGTAANVAYRDFSNQLASITFISTGIHYTHPIHSKILLVGGGMDTASSRIPGAYKKLKDQGLPVAQFWDQKDTHFILMNQREQVVDFFNQELSLK